MEDDFGVAIPGTKLPRTAWTETGIQRLPLGGHFNWAELFGRKAPSVLDLGCGNGRSTLTLALAHPDNDYFGCDTLPVAIRHAIRRANQRGLTNVRFAVADARELLLRLVAPESVAEVHLYHPQPYYDLGKLHMRLVTPEFLVRVTQALSAAGRIVVQTDNLGYWSYLQQILPLAFDFIEVHAPWPEAPDGISRREILARQHHLPIFRGVGLKRRNLDHRMLQAQAEQFPPPVFSADRRLRCLDRLE